MFKIELLIFLFFNSNFFLHARRQETSPLQHIKRGHVEVLDRRPHPEEHDCARLLLLYRNNGLSGLGCRNRTAQSSG